MFVSIKSALSKRVGRIGIKNQIQVIDNCKKVENILNKQIKTNFKIEVVGLKNKTLTIKTNNFQLANEVKLLESNLKRKFKESNIDIQKIRYM